MITAMVLFQLADDATLKDAAAIFRSTAPRYLDKAGLIRKYYIFEPETRKGGGCYLFENREVAEASFDDTWRALVLDKYKSEPEIRLFETPVIVDNTTGRISGI
ncbi:MAG: monooxygenase [Hyphomicrobiales bacterium]|nr:MAG: monooxygenase [Hyphomicrobiales bacterium]